MKASEEVFEISAIGMFARRTPTRHGLADISQDVTAAIGIRADRPISKLMGLS